MKIATATSVGKEIGPLTQCVYDFIATQTKVMEKGVSSPSDWDPLTRLVDPERFERVGAYLEVLNWTEYKDFLTRWMAGGTRFEMTEFHISEIGNTVFQEIEERHHRGGEFIRKNVVAIYRFDDQNRLFHLDIYEQAKDSGRWIIEAAKAATARV